MLPGDPRGLPACSHAPHPACACLGPPALHRQSVPLFTHLDNGFPSCLPRTKTIPFSLNCVDSSFEYSSPGTAVPSPLLSSPGSQPPSAHKPPTLGTEHSLLPGRTSGKCVPRHTTTGHPPTSAALNSSAQSHILAGNIQSAWL